MFGHNIVGWLESGIQIIITVVAGTTQMIVQVKVMMIVQFIIQIGTDHSQWTLIMTHRSFFAHNFITLAIYVSTIPVIFSVGGVHGQ